MQDLTSESSITDRANTLGTDFKLAPDEDTVKTFTEDDYLNGVDTTELEIHVIPPKQNPTFKVHGSSLKPRQLLAKGGAPPPPGQNRKARSKARNDARNKQRMAETRSVDAPTAMDDLTAGMRGHAGPRESGKGTGKPLIEVDLRNGGAVSVYDADGVKVVHRAYLSNNPEINAACMQAGDIVKRAGRDEGPEAGTRSVPDLYLLYAPWILPGAPHVEGCGTAACDIRDAKSSARASKKNC
ncbi:hypothetical protein C8R43DRAFT_144668 [Mycena crocata]|nr:hypothetical protein C8R43DRAFT_144668 [Mycena crocata]